MSAPTRRHWLLRLLDRLTFRELRDRRAAEIAAAEKRFDDARARNPLTREAR